MAKRIDSSLWKNIASQWAQFERFALWLVGDGSKINAWSSCWLEACLCLDQEEFHIPEECTQWHLQDLIAEEGGWNFHLLRDFLPSVFLEKFKAVMPPNPNRGKIREFSLGIELEIFLLQVLMSC